MPNRPDVNEPTELPTNEVDDLLAVLTHELSTPLTVIGGYAELLAHRADEVPVDPVFRDGLAAIKRNVDQLARLVEALVDARGLTDTHERVPLELGAFLRAELDDLAAELADRHVELIQGDEDLVVLADPAGVRQILITLLGNAVKFSPTDTPLTLEVRREGGRAQVTVSDLGSGVPVAREHELFGRFARLGSTRPGRGLGLHLSQLIAHRLGGDLFHRRTDGPGATFVLELPLAR